MAVGVAACAPLAGWLSVSFSLIHKRSISMDRRSVIKNAGIAGIVHAQANIRWRLTSSFPKSLDTIYGAAEDLCQARSRT
jgi:TRAP-type mannitol/chloroaromatic compound transport system substrate-binding protein